MVFLPLVLYIQYSCRSQEALVCRGRRNGTGIHQRNGGNLSALQLGTLPVGEIPGRVADGQRIVGRCISRAKAWSAERRLHDGTCPDQIRDRPIFYQLHIDRGAGRINAERKRPGADVLSPDDIRRRTDIFKSAARTAGNDPLLYI